MQTAVNLKCSLFWRHGGSLSWRHESTDPTLKSWAAKNRAVMLMVLVVVVLGLGLGTAVLFLMVVVVVVRFFGGCCC
jgi:hypothetical protein